jgi:DNA-binding transcriptional ArsR family regulator
MAPAEQTEELLTFFKALADATRLKIVGVLANGPSTVEQLAATLGLWPSTISHHLARLSEASLVARPAWSRHAPRGTTAYIAWTPAPWKTWRAAC